MKGKKMDFSKYTIGFGITGSFCTHEKIKKETEEKIESEKKKTENIIREYEEEYEEQE